MKPIQHGGHLFQAIEEFGGRQTDWLDLSTGISPFTIDLPEFNHDVWRRLPDPKYVALIEDKARLFYQTNANCLAVPGSQFAIQHLPHVLEGDVGILQPTYGEYAVSFTRQNRSFVSLTDIAEIGNVSSVVLANPNNPDGRLYAREILLELADQLSRRKGYLVVDEAFMTLDDHHSLLSAMEEAQNIIVLRSVGKLFGLAGIRLGFVFCSTETREKLMRYLGPWAVSGPALAVAEHVLNNRIIADELKHKISVRHQDMKSMLARSGLNIIGENDLFFLIQHQNAVGLHIELKKQKILTRIFDYKSDWMRIGLTANKDEDQRVFDGLNGLQI